MPRYEVNIKFRTYLDAEGGYEAEERVQRVLEAGMRSGQNDGEIGEWGIRDTWSEEQYDEEEPDEDNVFAFNLPEEDYNT